MRKRQAEKIRRDRTGDAYSKLIAILVRIDPEFLRKLEARSQRDSSLVADVGACLTLLRQNRLQPGTKERRFIDSLFSRHELIEHTVAALERSIESKSGVSSGNDGNAQDRDAAQAAAAPDRPTNMISAPAIRTLPSSTTIVPTDAEEQQGTNE